MRISDQQMMNDALRNMQINQERLSRSSERAVTGLAVEKPSDDPAAYSRAEDYQAQLTRMDGYDSNISMVRAQLNATDGTMQGMQGILTRLREEYADSPIEFESISIGNIAYPAEINAEIQRKLAAEQDLERMARERQIAEQEAQIVVTNARGRAAAQRIVNETLTPLYVQHEMLESFTQLSRSQRVTVIATPTSDTGGSPVVLGL